MVPWPIALLTLFYGALTAVSAVTVWQVLTGISHRALVWPMGWLALSAATMCGLPLLKAWARELAIAGSVLMLLVVLAVAGVLAVTGKPLAGLAAAVAASVHVIIIRYLRRPAVKHWFMVRSS